MIDAVLVALIITGAVVCMALADAYMRDDEGDDND